MLFKKYTWYTKFVEKRKYCPLLGKCGGCTYINNSYDEELIEKHINLEKVLGKYGKVSPIIKSRTMNYRCKVQAVCSKDKGGKFITGIYRKGTHKIIRVRSCNLENGKATAVLQTIRNLANLFSIPAYDEDNKSGILRFINIRVGYSTDEVMVTLITSKWDFEHKNDFVNLIHQKNPNVKTIVEIVNDKETSMVIPEDSTYRVLYGKGYITEHINGLTFRIGPTSFFQVNPPMAETLYNVAMNMAELRETDVVIDAYCGTGTISLIAAKRGVKKVIGIESNPLAIKDAEINANINNVENVSFIVGQAPKVLKQIAKAKEKVDVLFLDPPRSGANEEFLASSGRLNPEVIVYISCNPLTLSRDLRYITRTLNYKVRGIQPVDLFPASEHIETVVLLSRV